MLQLCISQSVSTTPYTFKSTGIRVFTIEEALFHAYHYWRESVDEFLCDEIMAWVSGLRHYHLLSKLTDIKTQEPLSRRLLAFLSIIEYFSPAELTKLKAELMHWEHRVEWEKLKDRADHLISKGEPIKALPLYRRALKYEQNAALLNNMAIANMKLANYKEAVVLLEKALKLQPNNINIALHYAEAAILNGDYESVNATLAKVTATGKADSESFIDIEVLSLRGLLAYHQKDYPAALDYFTKAGDTNMIASTYQQMRQYDKALAALGPTDHARKAEIYASYSHSHINEAISHLKEAIAKAPPGDALLWTKLAENYRKNHDWQRANEAISHALPSRNPVVLLENARIKKGLGRMRDYQAGLNNVLSALKERYRESE